MILTDTHCHLDLSQFDADRPAVLERAQQAGVRKILIPALDLDSALRVLQLTGEHAMLFAAVGVHPTEAGKWNERTYQDLAYLITEHHTRHKILAIGEIGLDYYWVKPPEERERQRLVFRGQLDLAAQVDLPVVIHMREEGDAWLGDASRDLLSILEEWCADLASRDHSLAKRPGVLHSFNGTWETAERALGMNFYIGVTGPVTYKNAEQKREVVKRMPLDRLLIETDSPYLAPVPQRGKRNEPAYVARIADKIAEIHSKDPAEIAKVTTANAAMLFAWGD